VGNICVIVRVVFLTYLKVETGTWYLLCGTFSLERSSWL